MDELKCKLCGSRHSLREPHKFEGEIIKIDEQPKVESRKRSGVTKHCPTCKCHERRVYANIAAKQRAYRQRKRKK